ncbi:unnamed protein product [Paramecium pentaurelia]|uniref:Uncharacterized protein n=1 Tax=Paramecium pentaurelia TaxID=43138 RepID=A0A8S1V0C4_9CILI|nr:unnamed protein product [Paramecium pentaurelia]
MLELMHQYKLQQYHKINKKLYQIKPNFPLNLLVIYFQNQLLISINHPLSKNKKQIKLPIKLIQLFPTGKWLFIQLHSYQKIQYRKWIIEFLVILEKRHLQKTFIIQNLERQFNQEYQKRQWRYLLINK